MRSDNINRVITQRNTKFGAPMGRANKGTRPHAVTSGPNCRLFKKNQPKIYNKRVVLIDGYDNGGTYWGIGEELRVEFTPDLSFINFYRVER